MFNFFSINRQITAPIFRLLCLTVTLLVIYFAKEIFTDKNVYFYTSSTIVQAFIALVAFLGTVVVFKVQLEDQAMERLAEAVRPFVRYYRGSQADVYTSGQMMVACQELLEDKNDNTHK